jgi:hypothetical protein
VQQSLPLVQPLIALLSSAEDGLPYPKITRALSALLAPLSFETLKEMGLYPLIEQGLRAPSPDLQILALEQVPKIKDVDSNITASLIECLGAEDAGVGRKAVDVITTVFPYHTIRRIVLF